MTNRFQGFQDCFFRDRIGQGFNLLLVFQGLRPACLVDDCYINTELDFPLRSYQDEGRTDSILVYNCELLSEQAIQSTYKEFADQNEATGKLLGYECFCKLGSSSVLNDSIEYILIDNRTEQRHQIYSMNCSDEQYIQFAAQMWQRQEDFNDLALALGAQYRVEMLRTESIVKKLQLEMRAKRLKNLP